MCSIEIKHSLLCLQYQFAFQLMHSCVAILIYLMLHIAFPSDIVCYMRNLILFV
jgi:hypothetical protein